MKTLYLVRHAKSDWTHDLPDYDRPLNDRGHSDAPKMAKHMAEQGYTIDCFVSSPAKRALTTCRYFAETFGNPHIKKEEDLYEPLKEDFTDIILNLSDENQSAALFSHNPTISEFASSLSAEPIEFPTCGVAIFKIDCDEWSLFEASGKRFIQFLKPKELFY